jgi:iron(III) transport system substrate-binding protein
MMRGMTRSSLTLSPILAAVLSVLLAACGGERGTGAGAAGPLIVYSSRAEHLIEPLFEAYTAETGVEIEFVTAEDQPLIQRLAAEGEATPADVLITVDAGNLWNAAELGLLRPIDSPVLASNVPAHLRDPEGRWFGLSVRARTIVYSTERVDPAELSTYEALAGPEWEDRLCLRTARKVYNQSLVAMLIAEYGEEKTERIVRGWVDNLAAPVFSNDTRLIEAVAEGRCDVGIVNTYYLGRLQRDEPALPVGVFWADQGGDAPGVHVNVSGAGVTLHADQPERAKALIEWLSTPPAQRLFAGLNLEYPVNPEVAPDPLVASWGEFRQSEFNLIRAGELQREAVMLMDRAGYR